MADDFTGSGHVTLQPGDVNVPVAEKFNPASASTNNDGAIPYGSTLSSVTFTCFHEDGTSSTALITSSRVSGNSAYAYLSYSTAVSDGVHHLTATAIFSLSGVASSMTREFDLNRIYVKDK